MRKKFWRYLIAFIALAILAFLFLCYDPGPEHVDFPTFIKAVSTETPKRQGTSSLELRVFHPPDGNVLAVLLDHERFYQRRYASRFTAADLPQLQQIATERRIPLTDVPPAP